MDDYLFLHVGQLRKMLGNLEGWLEKAEEHAKKKSFDVQVLLSDRLAPDQYPFLRQVQAACDAAKFLAARLTGKEAPKHPDTEQTLAEIRARIAAVREYLATFQAADFAGSGARLVPLSFIEGKGLSGTDYANELALPNFYFHVSTAYAILRHNGVDLGKRDFVGGINRRDV